MLTLKGVTKSYFGEDPVLQDLHLQLNRGEFLYVLGGTGAGKTSLLKLLATEELPSTGELSLFGYDVSKASASTLRSVRRAVGYIPQNVRLIPDLTVFDNVALALTLTGHRFPSAELRRRVMESLDRVGVMGLWQKRAGEISGGQAQRVAVARALVREPQLLIADEPTGAQDREFTWSLMNVFVGLTTKGTTVVVATHDRELVKRVRRTCATLRGGKLHVQSEAACNW